ncbi:MAG: ATP-binding protein [Erysipelothrix sp.]|nr:ATP-binding protein [Erysipelothrix sp.]
MERLKINVNISDEIQQNREKLLKELAKDKRVIKFLKDNNLDEKFLGANVQKFKDWIVGLDECEVCTGLDTCVKSVKGHYFDLVYDGILQKTLKPCRYQKELNIKTKYLENYLVRDFPDDLINISLSSIDFENDPMEYLEVVTKVSEYIDKPKGPGYYIYGDVGVGKTYLTTAITNELAKKNKKIAYVHVPTLASTLRGLISERISLDGILYKLKNVDVLVMDDIGAESVTNWFRDEILLSILNYRMEANKTCFYTSNLDLDELSNHYMYNNKNEYNKLAAIRLLERVRMTSVPISLIGKNRRHIISKGQ